MKPNPLVSSFTERRASKCSCNLPTFAVCALCHIQICLNCVNACCFTVFCRQCRDQHIHEQHQPQAWKRGVGA